MASRNTQEPTATTWMPQLPTSTIDVFNMKSFRLINVIAFLTITLTFTLISIPFDALRVKRGIEIINLSLNDNRISYLIQLKAKDFGDEGMGLYFSTMFAHHSIGEVTMGYTTIPYSSYCKNRFVAAYYMQKPLEKPKFVNVYDYYVGAITVSKYMQSNGDPEVYTNYDSSIYLIPKPMVSDTVIQADIHDMLYGDIDAVYQERFVDIDGKVIHEVKHAMGSELRELRIGQEKVNFTDPNAIYGLRAIEVPVHNMIKIVIFPLGSKVKNVIMEFYLHMSDWNKAYVGQDGLAEMIREHRIRLPPSEDPFAFKRIATPDRIMVPFSVMQDPNLLMFYHTADVKGWRYMLVFADRWHIIGSITSEKMLVQAENNATDRVLLVFYKDGDSDHAENYICTKNDMDYLYQSTTQGNGKYFDL